MISFGDAAEIVSAIGAPLGREWVTLARAHGRVLARPVVAEIDSPPADVSAMDGYAVRDEDLSEQPELRLIGEAFAGDGFTGEVGTGECVRIFTGAPVPAGADRVVVQEVVRREGDRAIVEGTVSPARHIRPRGSDFRVGDELLPAGRRLDARALVAAAGADAGLVEVRLRPRVLIIGTGDELAEPGTARERPGSIPESVSLGVAALAADWGGEVVGRQRLRDDREEMARAAPLALARADLVVVTGGASVGEKDFAKAMFAAQGLELIFSKVAIKPGKPVWLGTAGGSFVLGLPGNPTSALVTARLLLAPLLLRLGGDDPARALRWRNASLAEPLGACGDRETFVRGVAQGERVQPLANQDSGAQRTLAQADVLIRQRAGTPACAAGDAVEVIDF
jgi:molybdopterin molybdotransferase